MKKIFLLVLILPILVFGGLKGALWYFSKSAMDDLAKKVSSFVDLRYEKIETSLQGSVSINDIALYSALIDDTIKIKSLKLTTNDVFSLLTLHSKLKKNKIPESMLIHIQGIEMDMEGNIAKTLTSPDTPLTMADNIATLACGNTKRFDAKVLQDMGYETIFADFIFQYQFDESQGSLDLTLIENLDRLFSIKLNATVNNIRRLPRITSLTSLPKIGKVSLNYDDDSLASRKIQYCAKQNKSTQDEYIDKHVTLFDQYLQQLGINLGSDLLGAYKDSLKEPGNIDLTLDLRGIDDYMELAQIPIPDLIHNLSTELKVNDKKIGMHRLNINKDQFMQMALGHSKKAIIVSDPNVKPDKPAKAFHTISRTQLIKYNKHQVIIKTKNGKTYQGQLQVTKDRRFKYAVSSRTRGGQVSYHVDLEDIKSAQVYY